MTKFRVTTENSFWGCYNNASQAKKTVKWLKDQGLEAKIIAE